MFQRAAPAVLLGVVCLLGGRPASIPGSAFGDVVESQGIERTGVAALTQGDPRAGLGLKIAVLDLGFGTQLAARQSEGELPSSAHVTTRSFDPAGGLQGTNAYGNPTGHGTIVAQTLFDYAPAADYIFVSYHTPEQFVEATDWLAAQQPDIVLHSNNFIEGPFDGTSPAAQAVDRAAARGVLWFNSAGNYGDRHWEGEWIDTDGDRVLDWPVPWTMLRNLNDVTTFALSWTNPEGAEPTDLDLVLERRAGDGWQGVRDSRDVQGSGAAASERITGYVSPSSEDLRLRVVWRSGPPPSGPLTLFSREIPLAPIGGTAAHSIPTPADAAGSISIGAVDWRTNGLKVYSSQGPTADGRLKPDLVAPTGTVVRDGAATRGIGGTSNAAPNAAGAAAVLMWSLRSSGLSPNPPEVLGQLLVDAGDLGPSGPDPAFGYGVVRVDTDPPVVEADLPGVRAVSGRTSLSFRIADAGKIRSVRVMIDGVRRFLIGADIDRFQRLFNTRGLSDGPHEIDASAVDVSGNRGATRWSFVVDNTPPVLRLRDLRVSLPAVGRPGRMGLRIAGADTASPSVRIDVRLAGGGSRTRATAFRVLRGTPRLVRFDGLASGRYRLEVVATDDAGNVTRSTTPIKLAAVVAGQRATP